MLSNNQKAIITRIAKDPTTSLYKATSGSGLSETLRYRRRWIDHSQWGKHVRTESHMVFSVKINVLPNGKDDPASLAKYNAKCEAAFELFNAVRQSSDR